jgi:phosphate starvation-inducible PhoH-like protein
MQKPKRKKPAQEKGAAKEQKGQTPDTSPKVYQREKIDWTLNIRELPWTEKQKAFLTLANHKDTRVIFLTGPAGSSKSTVAVRAALELLNQKKISDLICVRAAVESGDTKLGMLPGDVDDKLGEYMTPFGDKLEEMLCTPDRMKLKAENRIIYKPVNFCRGASWTAKCIIVDEAQNLTLNELQTLMTRIGKFSKLIICADPDQSDLPYNKQGGFTTCAKIFDTEAAQGMGIFSAKFTKDDIVRSELCKFIVETFDDYKQTLPPPVHPKH